MTTDRIVAEFVTASAHLESHLQQQGSLTPVQEDAIANTIQGLQTFFDLWKMKGRRGGQPSHPEGKAADSSTVPTGSAASMDARSVPPADLDHGREAT
jgi:hypothetical protein